ncbi:solute carrier family 49 member 4 homolog [Exaiptasia diaphana]|uniref:Uncharacterized protein n=1 Tax=Exaiptasia diaphana TaxID=2652724 RepID=A0A913WSZ5_EXADI|nr:solute carrier family 49 member 4 homolog [Exaiptasia diaphana]
MIGKSYEERASLLKSVNRPYQAMGKSVHQATCKVYKRRWYILLIFSLVASLNNVIWNAWGPIQATSQVVFEWDNTVITLLADWGPISYVLAVIPMSWLMDAKGLRVSVLLAAFLELIGTALRCFSLDNKSQTLLIHIGQFVTGIGGPVAMAAPPLVSAAWFPPSQRTTATAISSLACYSGTALSFLIGPLLVDDVGKLTNGTSEKIDYNKLRKSLNASQIAEYKHQIMNFMYLEFGVTAFVFLCVLIYFPDKPRSPPSITAAIGRLDFTIGFKSLLRKKRFWLLVFIYGLSTGIYGAWCSVLDLNLSVFGIDQKTASWLGFGAVVAGSVSGISLSIFADHFTNHMKTIVILLMIGASISLALFSLVCIKVLPLWNSILYVTSILGGFFVNGSIPLFFELGVESTYPIAEGITSGCLTFSNNFIQVVFYIFPMIPHFGTSWINWVTFGSCLASVPLLVVWKAKYYRSQVDKRTPYVPVHGPISYGSAGNERTIIGEAGENHEIKEPFDKGT